jgi:hypothetical protein
VTKLKERIQEEQERRMATEKTIREEERRNREEIVREKDARIQALDIQMKELSVSIRESSRQVSEQFQNFKDQMLKNTSGSKKKGDIGEAVFESIMERVFGSGSLDERFDLQNVGKEGHQGDLRMNWQGHRFLLEVKNYDRNVDGKEVTKFLRDMEESKDCPIGMMISLTTGITGHMKSGKVDIEMLHDGRMCLYINSLLLHEDPVSLMQSLKPFLEVYLKSLETKAPMHEEEEVKAKRQMELFEQQRTAVLKVLQLHEEQMRKMKATLMNAKKKQEQYWVEIFADMREAEHRVKLLMETMLEFRIEESDDEIEELDGAFIIPGYIFRHTDMSLYTEKERKFVKETLDHFEMSEDYKMQTKDAKDLYKKLGYTDETLTAMRSHIFQDDVWEKNKKELKYMRLRKNTKMRIVDV